MRVQVRPFPPPDAPLVVPTGGVHVWQFDPSAPPIPGAAAHLSADETARGDRYRVGRTRDQFVACRGHLRALLGQYLGCSPKDVPLTVTADGKPVLGGAFAGRAGFNVSHTDGLALIAVTGGAVGVDVEPERPLPTADAIVGRFFAAVEQAQYAGLPGELRGEAFLRGWTCKEAVLKAVGTGVRAFEAWGVDLDPRRPPAVVWPAASGWAVGWWRPAAGYVAAVAVQGERVAVEVDE